MTSPKPLAHDITTPVNRFDPALTFCADGTRVVVSGVAPTGAGRLRDGMTGVTCGMSPGSPYSFQAVRWDEDGSVDHVAPHVLAKVTTPAQPGPSAAPCHGPA